MLAFFSGYIVNHMCCHPYPNVALCCGEQTAGASSDPTETNMTFSPQPHAQKELAIVSIVQTMICVYIII